MRAIALRMRSILCEHAVFTDTVCEPFHEHGPGIVGDIGERSNAHPVCEIESNFDVSHGAAVRQQ